MATANVQSNMTWKMHKILAHRSKDTRAGTTLKLAASLLLCSMAVAADTPATQSANDREPGLQVPQQPEAEIPAGVEFRKDVTYLPTDRAEKLDLYLPKTRAPGTKSPAIVIIHGGAWRGGNKSARREIDSGTTLALAGYVCASVEYDKTPGNWPRNLLDCKNAVRFLRAKADELGVDAANIGVIGGSAGGHLAQMVAFTSHVDALEPQQPYPGISDGVSACASMYGPSDLFLQNDVNENDVRAGKKPMHMFPKDTPDLAALWRQASPVHYVRADNPAVLILQGEADTIVRPTQARLLDEKLTHAGVEHQTVIIPDTPHTFTLHSVKSIDLAKLTVAFFDKHLKTSSSR